MDTSAHLLPVPDDFRFDWDSPEEAARFWIADLMHWPHGISNLSATMDMPAFGSGMKKAADALCMPFRDVQFKHVNGYVYNSFEPWSYDPDEMQSRMQQMQVKMMQHIPGLLDRWNKEYEPEVRSINEEVFNGNYKAMTDGELSGLLEGLFQKREREGELHFLAVFPAMGAVMFFEEVYTNLFGPPKDNEHLQLLQGFSNKSVEAGVGIWRLAQEARKRPEVMDILQRVPPAQVHDALGFSEQSRAFRGAVDEFLHKYGWRAAELDIADPTWAERPGPVYNLIREYAARDDYSPEEEMTSLVTARKAREDHLLQRLNGGPVELFRQALTGAQQYLPIQEDHNFWIDQQGVSVQRLPVLDAGRRLVASGRLARPEDVFLLKYENLQDALRGRNGSLADLVERYRREREESRGLTPPPAIGTPPPVVEDNPMVTKFWGGIPPESADPRVINGNAASAGKVTATARVIHSLEDADRLSPGEILVCPATMPPWTPLFAYAAAVVTDHGGILSHTAIVAREYRIPAVVGTKMGTAIIRDGQTITVDGAAGTVKLES